MSNRRKFVKKLGLSGLAAMVRIPATASAEKPSPSGSHEAIPGSSIRIPGSPSNTAAEQILLSNGIGIGLLIHDGQYYGIGQVTAGPTILRSGTHAMSPEFRTPDGNLVTRMTIRDKKTGPDGILLHCSVSRHTIPVMEYMLHSVRNRENLYGWAENEIQDPETSVTVEISPVTRKVGRYPVQGFSYQYKYHGAAYPLFKILDRATWEIGGDAIGNEVWMRVGHVPSIVDFDKPEQRYSTENYMYGIANPNIFQFLPLQTELQGFTFQCHAAGALVTWATQVSHVRTLLEKPAGSRHCYHFHQHCNDLAETFETSPMEVLWYPQTGMDRTAKYNFYEAVRQVVHGELHRQAGIRPEYISTYGMIEQWDEPDMDRYTDEILPQFASRGIQRIFLPNEFENVMNVWGLSNMCCNVDFKFMPEMAPRIKRFCQAARTAGITIDMWGNTALSTTTEMFQWRDGKEKGIRFLPREGSIMEVLRRAKDPFVRNPSNAIEGDHYTPRFAVLNFRDPDVMAYWLKCWKEAYDIGITGIFLDSSFNMTSDKFHFVQNAVHDTPYPPAGDPDNPSRFFRPDKPFPSAIKTQFFAHLEMIKGMQAVGYSYCGEDLGVFGIHRHGPDVDMVVGCIPLWNEAVLDFDEKLVRKKGYDPYRVYFEGMAHRIAWTTHWSFKQGRLDNGIDDPRAIPLLKIFNTVNGRMRNKEILREGRLVKYRSEDTVAPQDIYWACEAITAPLNGTRRVEDLVSGRSWQADTLQAEDYHVYIVS